jgi:hypothetical protein
MNYVELEKARRQKWRLDGEAVRTLEDARAFIESVGFCLLLPLRPPVPTPVVMPTFVGAWAGSDRNLPTWQMAFADPRAQNALELMVRLLRERAAYEANLFEENNAFLVSASVFPYLYALVGERNPKQTPKPTPRSEYSQLACDTFAVIQRDGPISKPALAEKLGGGVSIVALDRSLGELWSRLRITRVDYKPGEGAFWDVLYRWSPDAVREGVGISVPAALTALVSKYVDAVVAAEQSEVEAFLGNIVARSRVKEAMNALLAARELSFVHVGNRSLIQITPPPEPRTRQA